jgi:hypothetical protein
VIRPALARAIVLAVVTTLVVTSEAGRAQRRDPMAVLAAVAVAGTGAAQGPNEDLATAAEPRGPVVLPGPPAGLPLDSDLRAEQWWEYEAVRPKTVLELQRFRRATTLPIAGRAGRKGIATLVDLNPRVNEWYVLELTWDDGQTDRLHLENARPGEQILVLDPAHAGGIVVRRSGEDRPCELWSEDVPAGVADAAGAREPYVRLCGGEVHARHRTDGSRTAREWGADFLRNNVWGGESIAVLVRDTVYGDAFLERPRLATPGSSSDPPPDGPDYPGAAATSPEHAGKRLVASDLGIAREGDGAMVVGRWYPVSAEAGVFVGTIVPGDVASQGLAPGPRLALDAVERNAVVHLVAFDLDRFDLGFEPGTDHPDVGWSERVVPGARDPVLPGPDGIADTAPLEPTGLLPPWFADRIVATFAGGFKRLHGAFRSGALARVNGGSHYGFVAGGAVLSKLQPGLSTLFALEDGRVEMKTWECEDDALLERVRFARQNGVAVLERDPDTGRGVPGELIGSWAEGNWAGSKDSKLRSVRAAACLQGASGRRFLIYAHFSSATPAAMARVLEAYGCSYGMHLDMNALEHTYLALYRREAGKLGVEHLVRGMSALEKTAGETTVPRFVGYADNRDFFYLLRKPGSDAARAHPGAAAGASALAFAP